VKKSTHAVMFEVSNATLSVSLIRLPIFLCHHAAKQLLVGNLKLRRTLFLHLAFTARFHARHAQDCNAFQTFFFSASDVGQCSSLVERFDLIPPLITNPSTGA
jgi:hypothetical protein